MVVTPTSRNLGELFDVSASDDLQQRLRELQLVPEGLNCLHYEDVGDRDEAKATSVIAAPPPCNQGDESGDERSDPEAGKDSPELKQRDECRHRDVVENRLDGVADRGHVRSPESNPTPHGRLNSAHCDSHSHGGGKRVNELFARSKTRSTAAILDLDV